MGSVRVAIVGVGNCASSLVQGVEYYRNADPNDRVPGLMHVKFGDYHVSDVQFVAAFDVDAKKVGRTSPTRSSPARTTPSRSATCRPPACSSSAGRPSTASASTTARWSRSPTQQPVDVVAALRDAQVDVRRLLPAGRLGGGGQVLRPGRDRRGLRLRQRAAGVHRLRPGVGAEVHRRRAADRRRRHQVARSAPRSCTGPGQAVRGPRGRAAAHVPAQLRRQHGLHEHAGAHPAGLEEDLEDPVGHLADPARDGASPTSTSDRPTTCRGSTTASGPTSGSRAGPSATSRSARSSSSRSGTRPTRPASSSTPIRAAKIALDRKIGGPDPVRVVATS